MKQVLRVAGAMGLLLLFAATTAVAIPYKNPAHGLKPGAKTAGAMFESAKRDVTAGVLDSAIGADSQMVVGTFGFAVGTGGALELHLGGLNSAFENMDSSAGVIYGASYRHDLSAGKVHHGLLIAFHAADVSNDSSESYVSQFDAGYGAAFTVAPGTSLYGGGVFSQLEGTLDLYSVAYDFEGESIIGAFVGFEKAMNEGLLLGVEFHLLHETAFGAYLEGRF